MLLVGTMVVECAEVAELSSLFRLHLAYSEKVALHSGDRRNRSWKDMLLVRIMVVEYAEVAELSRLFRLVVDR
ncbi:hypothetical protein CDAR_470361 [Caerostris darwini]|uniref:Uncharacterized protein n=1 Tax=Caerostris darwini TaxID=1538125 RepID=A0AAV4PSQ8_9ARAC|nr:hypothetical protein CDAR_470361 [Caerostris darwini]